MKSLALAGLVVIGSGVIGDPGAFAADAVGNRKANVESLARRMEGAVAADRAKAITELGAIFPEGAAAVPVLIDATADDDEGVRRAAVAALRRLGNAGLAGIARRIAVLPEGSQIAVNDVGFRVAAMGDFATATYLAYGLTLGMKFGPDPARGTLFVVAATPPRLVSYSRVSVQPAPWISITLPWLSASDPSVAETAAEAFAIAGRAVVADAPWDSAAEASLASPDALAPLLDARAPATRWLAWRYAAHGAPHSERVIAAILEQWPKAKSRTGKPDMDTRQLTDDACGGALYRSLLRSAGARSAPLAEAVNAPSPELETPDRLASLAAFGRADDAMALWKQSLRAAVPRPREPRDQLDDVPIREAVLIPSLRSTVAADVKAWFETMRTKSDLVRTLRKDATSLTENDRRELTRLGTTPLLEASAVLVMAPPADLAPAAAADAKAMLERALLSNVAEPQWVAAKLVLAMGAGGKPFAPSILTALGGADLDLILRAELTELVETLGPIPAAAQPMLSKWATTRAPLPPLAEEDQPPPNDKAGPLALAAYDVSGHGFLASAPQRIVLAAIDALGRIEGDSTKARSALEPLLKDADPQVRYRAARSLRRLAAAK